MQLLSMSQALGRAPVQKKPTAGSAKADTVSRFAGSVSYKDALTAVFIEVRRPTLTSCSRLGSHRL